MSISVRQFTKSFGGTQVVNGISFEVDAGEFVSLLGPSGCGKTTTLRTIAGLEEASGGSVSISGATVSDPLRGVMVPPHLRHIGMVFQSYAIWPHMSVARNVGFPVSVRGASADQIDREVDKALDIVGLTPLRDRLPAQLSGGQQQRVALARAIVGQPKVLLFDEPLSNLDAKLRESTRLEIRRLQRRLGVAALYVTHDQEEALSMSDRVIVMEGGNILQQGAPKELYRRPANRFVATFVGRASFFDLKRSDQEGLWSAPDGTLLAADDSGAAGLDTGEGMLRPEGVQIGRGSPSGRPLDGSDNLVPGKIVDSQYLGGHTEYEIETCGIRIRAHSAEDFDPGSSITLRIPRDRLRVVTQRT